MVTTARAALSVVLLLGFYVYAFGVVVAFGALTVLLATTSRAPLSANSPS